MVCFVVNWEWSLQLFVVSPIPLISSGVAGGNSPWIAVAPVALSAEPAG